MQVRVGGGPLDGLVVRVDRVQRPVEPAREQVGKDQPAEARPRVARSDHGDRPRSQEGLERTTGGRTLIGQHRLEVRLGLLHGEAGVHPRPADLLLVVETELGEQAQHRDIIPRHIAQQSPHPDVTRRVSQPAQEHNAEPDAPVGGINEHQELSGVA